MWPPAGNSCSCWPAVRTNRQLRVRQPCWAMLSAACTTAQRWAWRGRQREMNCHWKVLGTLAGAPDGTIPSLCWMLLRTGWARSHSLGTVACRSTTASQVLEAGCSTCLAQVMHMHRPDLSCCRQFGTPLLEATSAAAALLDALSDVLAPAGDATEVPPHPLVAAPQLSALALPLLSTIQLAQLCGQSAAAEEAEAALGQDLALLARVSACSGVCGQLCSLGHIPLAQCAQRA